ncbi:MAG: hypothetical protein KJ970_07220 [Candidatus Eisenbacteria bacterium]|uniref:Plastocyanin-like domain-containing protein n=1 Tax=Eiseniibacteriota bacterium TaxID=2212470 RepID=A0A948RW04_UNCEI|nr:hypothetical protein [Candidatus Eisenbacteria bacterium]MBU1950248.1 hypothetical protein [Candidatus Eisenbacteria bacterium]MBU2690704.1 hypothetical protein [Candidatus Eisenbacteria bacterium]
MKSMKILLPLLFIMVLWVTACEDTQKPGDDDWVEEKPPITHGIVSDPDSFTVEASPQYTVSRDDLDLNGIQMAMVGLLLPHGENSFPENRVSREFVITPGDSISVTVSDCPPGVPWVHFIDGDDLVLSREDSTNTGPGTCNRIFVFTATERDKGYFALVETNPATGGQCISSSSPALMLSYTAGPVDSLWVDLQQIIWEYTASPHSNLRLNLQGVTNASRLRIETYGDGAIGSEPIPLNLDGSFHAEIGIAFSHLPRVLLETSSMLCVYGAPGCPVVIELE